MNYSYFGQTNQNTAPIPPSNQTANIQQAAGAQPFIQNQFSNNTMSTSLFPAPTGSVYSLNTASDIGNVPAGLGISVGLCLSENVMYIKALQNGSPVLLGYKLSPIEGNPNSPQNIADEKENISNTEELIKENKKLIEVLKGHSDKIQLIETQLAKIKDRVGGKNEWQF